MISRSQIFGEWEFLGFFFFGFDYRGLDLAATISRHYRSTAGGGIVDLLAAWIE